MYTPPPLDEVWLHEPEQKYRKEQLSYQRERTAQRERAIWVDKLPQSTKDDDDDAPPTLLPWNVVSDSDLMMILLKMMHQNQEEKH